MKTGMKRALLAVAALALTGWAPSWAAPEDDRIAFVKYFQNRFPMVKDVNDFADGLYAIDQQSREQWELIEEFPPYEEFVERGQELFETPFANGKTYADCFQNGGIGIRQNYPYFDTERKEVITLELAINRCREANGEEALKWETGAIAEISGYMAFTSRGNPLNIEVPNADALAAYEAGKKFYYAKKGYLNNSCATCHVQGAGMRARSETMHPALGESTNFPTFRLKWDHLGTLHKRIRGCHRDQGARSFKAQSPQYRNLEYFITYMANGLQVNGPSVRK